MHSAGTTVGEWCCLLFVCPSNFRDVYVYVCVNICMRRMVCFVFIFFGRLMKGYLFLCKEGS